MSSLTSEPYSLFRPSHVPRWALVRHRIDDTVVHDVQTALEAAIRPVLDLIRPTERVCLAVGSRGIDRISEVVRAAVSVVRDAGASVFVVPAMGSHGAATADGQLEVLASLGITSESIGCEIRSSMQTIRIGDLDGRIPIHFDRTAYEEADAVIPINRVKPHTDFSGPSESGLLKMIAIGLGKQRGANALHAEGFASFAELIPAIANRTLSRVHIPFGIALLENGHARLRRIEAVPASTMLERERSLRQEAEQYMARLPLAALDILFLDRIGKDISGIGMDPKVIGRYYTGPTGTGPNIQRIVVRDLSDGTGGNGVGIGLADIVLRRVVDRLDTAKTYMNCITSKTPEGARIALTVETDRQALEVALACCTRIDIDTPRIARIRDTLHLGWLYATEAVVPDLLASGTCEVVRAPGPIAFDSDGHFADELPT